MAGNLAVLILAATQAWPWAHQHRVQFSAANILISVLARNEVSLKNSDWTSDYLAYWNIAEAAAIESQYPLSLKGTYES